MVPVWRDGYRELCRAGAYGAALDLIKPHFGNDPNATLVYLDLLVRTNRALQAVGEAKSLAATNPGRAKVGLAWVSFLTGSNGETARLLEALADDVLEADDTSVVLYLRAELAEKAGKLDLAEHLNSQALLMVPGLVPAIGLRIALMAKRGEDNEVEAALSEAADAGVFQECLTVLVQALMEMQMNSRALALLKSHPGLSGKYPLSVHSGYLHLRLLELDEAEVIFKAILEEVDDPFAVVGLGSVFYLKHDYRSAEALLKQVLDDPFVSDEAFGVLGRLYLRRLRPDKFLRTFTHVVRSKLALRAQIQSCV